VHRDARGLEEIRGKKEAVVSAMMRHDNLKKELA